MTGKQYVRPVRSNWWLKKRSYTMFMVRELTSAFIAAYSIFLIVLVRWASHGIDAFRGFCAVLTSPVSILFNVLVLAAAIYHSITWFNLTPKIMVFWRGEEKVSDTAIQAGNFVLWVVVSAVVAAIVFAVAKA
jgi:succinate dehydrogenase subunit C